MLDTKFLNSMIDESKCNWLKEPVDFALTRINGAIFTTAAYSCLDGRNKPNITRFTKQNIKRRKFSQKERDITVEVPDNVKFFFVKTTFGNNIEGNYSICYITNIETCEQTHYPLLANIHNSFWKIKIDKNKYQPLSYEKVTQETKTKLMPNCKPKLKYGTLPIIGKNDLDIAHSQKRP